MAGDAGEPDDSAWLSARDAVKLLRSLCQHESEVEALIVGRAASGLAEARCRRFQIDPAAAWKGDLPTEVDDCALIRPFWIGLRDSSNRDMRWAAGDFEYRQGDPFNIGHPVIVYRAFGVEFRKSDLAPLAPDLSTPDRAPGTPSPQALEKLTRVTAAAPPTPPSALASTRPRLADSEMKRFAEVFVGVHGKAKTEAFAHQSICALFPNKHVPRDHFLGIFRSIRGYKKRGKQSG